MHGTTISDSAIPKYMPFRGWALALAAQVDATCARGLVADLYRASALKRQAAFVMLASFREIPPMDFLRRLSTDSQDVSTAVRCHTARELIGAALGVDRVPGSFWRALARIGDQPLVSPEDYRRLFDLLDPNRGSAVKVQAIRYCNEPITSARIHAVDQLHPELIFPAMVAACDTPKFAGAANEAYSVLSKVCSSLDHEEGKARFRKLVENSGSAAFGKMLEYADRLPPPPFGGDDFTPLKTAADMIQVATEFRNCLKSKIASVALGRTYYFRHDDLGPEGTTKAVVEIEALSNGEWQVTTIEGPKGTRLQQQVRTRILKRLIAMGALLSGPADVRYSHDTLGIFGIYPLSWEATDWLSDDYDDKASGEVDAVQ